MRHKPQPKTITRNTKNKKDNICDICPLLPEVEKLKVENSLNTTLHVSNKVQHAEIQKRVEDIHSKLDTVLNVQVNGRKGFQESMADIYNKTNETYEITKNERNRYKLKQAIYKFLENGLEGKFLSTKLGKIIAVIVTLWISFSSLHTIGFERLHPWNLIAQALEFLLKVVK